MTVFGAYARYYDLLYQDKDYAGEAAYVASQLRALGSPPSTLLELGSGTGSHALELAALGFDVTGIDRSADMVARAETRRSSMPPDVQARLRFVHGDAQTARLGRSFDAAFSVFHVLSYQTSNADVAAFLHTAAAHLPSGALFLADFWYGPAVLSQKPETRTRTLRDGDVEFTRLAEPTLRENENRVDVRYTVSRAGAAPLIETHAMRYFFLPELALFLAQAGFDLLHAGEMPGGAELSVSVWSAAMVARKRE
jgi:SAM-dependent methyltransferase